MNIQGINSFSYCAPIDEEEKRIMQKLMSYGVTPTGNKTTDKATLRRIELEKAKESNYIRNDLLTVSKIEQERIQAKKKEKQKDLHPDINPEKFEGSKVLGEQIYLAIKMKKNTTTS